MKKLLSVALMFGFVVSMAAITGCGDDKKSTTPAADSKKDKDKDKDKDKK